ncbi:MAG: PDZ domain-containing protein [Armatimonadetes bacterium]|nr:PDZ domain-containing protein [Armatimonadota bacterium]
MCVALALTALVMASCSSVGHASQGVAMEANLVGSWKSQELGTIYNFKSDGSYTDSNGNVLKYAVDYPYLVVTGPSGAKISLTIVDYNYSAKPKSLALRDGNGFVEHLIELGATANQVTSGRSAENAKPSGIGVSLEPILASNAQECGLSPGQGWYVNSISKGGPAWNSGIRAGDFLIAANGSILNSFNSGDPLADATFGKHPGDAITLLTYRRDASGKLWRYENNVVLK